MSAHHAHLFAAEITNEELARLRASQATPHGAGDTEQTWPEITTFGELRQRRLVDWATLGMIAQAALIDMTAVRLGVMSLILSRRVRPLAIAAMAFNLLRAAGALVGRDYARARAAPIGRDLVAVAGTALPATWHLIRESVPLRG